MRLNAPSRWLVVPGARLHYRVSGSDELPPVLLWHGAGCNLEMWQSVAHQLKSDFRFIQWDIRGCGQSHATAPATYCLERYAQDACGLLDALCIDRCHLWSMAWGSRAALVFAARYPERVQSAALFDLSIDVANPAAQKIGANASPAAT